MTVTTALTITIFAILGYCYLFPLDALAVVRSLRLRFKSYLVRKYGTLAYEEYACAMRRKARRTKQPLKSVEAYLSRHKLVLIEYFGQEIYAENTNIDEDE